MVKRRQVIFLTLFFLIIFLVFISFVFFKSKEDKETEVFIPRGSSPVKISRILKDADVISSSQAFLITVKTLGYSKNLQAGLYVFNKKDSLVDIINKLKNGENKNVKVTIPEGFNIKQIAQALNEKNVCDKEKFISLAREKILEGYLFPDTYFFTPQSDEKDIIKIMSERFNKFWTAEKEDRLRQINRTKKEVIILASIVEKEAVSDEERPIIAGIFYNRLAKKMRLESCATVLYAMGVTKERLTFDDLKLESPYNTYKYGGLPPAPICSPGAKAIDAVLYPAQTDSLYFVSKGNGTHYFSSTFEQHIKNKIQSKKKNRNS